VFYSLPETITGPRREEKRREEKRREEKRREEKRKKKKSTNAISGHETCVKM
jgi:hypothetical protein